MFTRNLRDWWKYYVGIEWSIAIICVLLIAAGVLLSVVVVVTLKGIKAGALQQEAVVLRIVQDNGAKHGTGIIGSAIKNGFCGSGGYSMGQIMGAIKDLENKGYLLKTDDGYVLAKSAISYLKEIDP